VILATFALAAGLLLHAYVGYPLSLLVLRLIRGEGARHRVEERTPSLTLVISAYNEERVLKEKIENALALDYPEDRIERVVVSDGSTDGTEAIVQAYADRGVRLVALEGRRGKVACLNEVVPTLRTDLAVMSDANSMYAPDSLRRLVRHFVDPRVGCVCGQLAYVNRRRLPAGEGERLYWSYEGLIKRLESSIGTLLGANGAIYAYRRELFEEVNPLMFCDDVIPVRIAIGRRLTLYEPEALCVEEAVGELVEMQRRRRHASFGLRSMLLLVREAARAGRPLIVYQCVSHRMLRWLGGPAVVVLLASSFGLPEPWRWLSLSLQGGFYGAAALGCVLNRLGIRVIPLYLPYYFLVIAVAGTRGLLAFALRTDRPFWEPRQ